MAMNCTSSAGSDSVLNSTLNTFNCKDDTIKSQFIVREGIYKLMTSSEYSRPTRLNQPPTPVKVSFITLPGGGLNAEKICFNVGKELFVHNYRGVKKAGDLSKPVDKRVYKGTHPTCHDFNQTTVTSDSVYLLIGFSAGQIQLIDPIKKEISKLYNEERLIDKTKVTCLKWLPGSSNLFLVSHGSGQLYVYKEELPCGSTPPNYQIFKQGDNFSIYTCKTKSTRNPLYRWVIGEGSLNEFAFSPCSKYLATVSQDGFLRVFNYDTMELVGRVRSYFGGLLCVCWSPDGKYIVVGGEDDLVTVWSFIEKRVVARGHGHKSWVSVVAFDPYTTSLGDFVDLSGSDEELAQSLQQSVIDGSCSNTSTIQHTAATINSSANAICSDSGVCLRTNSSSKSTSPVTITSYRFGSVGQDTQLCLWDLSDDVLKQPVTRSRTSVHLQSPSAQLLSSTTTITTPTSTTTSSHSTGNSTLNKQTSVNNTIQEKSQSNQQANCLSNSHHLNQHSLQHNYHHHCNHYYDGFVLPNNNNNNSNIVNSKTVVENKKEHKRNFSLGNRNSDKNSVNKASHSKLIEDPVKLLGTSICPRLDEVPMLEPLVCKKIAHERLTALVFLEDCFVVACQEGFVCTWARPGKSMNMQMVSSPTPSLAEELNENEENGSTIV